MVVSSAILVMASAMWRGISKERFRAEMRLDMATEADLVLDNTAAAISVSRSTSGPGNPRHASIDPHVKRACLYLPTGDLFAA